MKKRPLKKRIGDWLFLNAGIPAIYVLFRLIVLTLRRRSAGECEKAHADFKEGERVIFAFWHGDSFYITQELDKLLPYRDHYVMASQSRDGALMAKFLRMAGVRVVRGSSSRGGGRALVEMIRAMGDNGTGALAVDAPRGPRHRVNKNGILILAKRLGAPILPVAARAEKKWVFRSWDRTEVPKPFSTTTVHYGPYLRVPPDADEDQLDALRVELEKRLVELKQDDVTD